MKKPEVTIVIPLYNRAHLIERTLESVSDQSYRPIRLIVVDNNSSDSSSDVVAGWASRHETVDFRVTLLHESRQGAAIARNTGLAACDTEWVFFFDSDDRMLPSLVESVMTETRRDPELDIVFWQTAFVMPDGRIKRRPFSLSRPMHRHLYNCLLSTQAFAVKSAFIRSCGGWNERLKVWDDWELGFRLLTASPRMKGIDRILVHIYPQEESLTGLDYNSKSGKWEEAIGEMEHHARSSADSRRDIWLRMLLYRRINLAALYSAEGRKDLGEALKEETMQSEGGRKLSRGRRLLLNLIYEYTRRGGRAAYLLWD